MKKKNLEKMREMSMSEIADELKKLTKELATVRHELSMGKTNKSGSVQSIKRDIAQIKLIVHNMHLAETTVKSEPSAEKAKTKEVKNG